MQNFDITKRWRNNASSKIGLKNRVRKTRSHRLDWRKVSGNAWGVQFNAPKFWIPDAKSLKSNKINLILKHFSAWKGTRHDYKWHRFGNRRRFDGQQFIQLNEFWRRWEWDGIGKEKYNSSIRSILIGHQWEDIKNFRFGSPVGKKLNFSRRTQKVASCWV